MGLLDLAGVTSRTYGGLGFFLQGPKTTILIERAESSSSLYAEHLSERDIQDLHETIDRWEKSSNGSSIVVNVKQTPPQHVGLGTKTAMILGILLGAAKCWETHDSTKKLQRLAERGGVSGIGINGFFTGGFIVDCGQPESAVPSFAPSSFSVPQETPPVSVRCEIPSDWRITLYLPDGANYHGERELEFFDANTPIPDHEVKDAISIVYHGIVPGILTEDLGVLSESLADFHDVGFKRREVDGQTKDVKSLLNSLQSLPDVAAGMSSMGPLVYAICRKSAVPDLPELNNGLEVLGTYAGRNQGANHRLKN